MKYSWKLYLYFRVFGSLNVSCTLVNLDLREGFVKSITLKKEGLEGPFCCARFHIYGHLLEEFSLPNWKQKWVHKSRGVVIKVGFIRETLRTFGSYSSK